jgi:hypothetical protein
MGEYAAGSSPPSFETEECDYYCYGGSAQDEGRKGGHFNHNECPQEECIDGACGH